MGGRRLAVEARDIIDAQALPSAKGVWSVMTIVASGGSIAGKAIRQSRA